MTGFVSGDSSPEQPRGAGFMVHLGLALNLIVFATLLNSVGIVVERSISEFGVSKTIGGTLEGCKDLTIAFTSLVLASQVPKIGYRRVMLGGLAIVMVACSLLASFQQFWTVPLLFVLCGASFAMVKVAVYASVGLISGNAAQHATQMNRLEGIYQLGAMVSPLVFAEMIARANWTQTYWFVVVLAAVAMAVWAVTPLDESGVRSDGKSSGMGDVWGLLRQPIVLVFLFGGWVYVMIEQSIGTWLPTFQKDVFHLSPELAARLLSVYFGLLALSRFTFGALARRFSPFALQVVFLSCAFALTLGVLLSTKNAQGPEITQLSQVPFLAIAFCSVGFLIGPIYPTLNSMLLSRLDKGMQSTATGLIIIFSALGGTSGSQVIGYLSEHQDTHTAFHFPLLPMVALIGLLFLSRAQGRKENA
jgi:MFS transporter, FHS family, glucose/mannose:H+ symporter